MTKSTHFVITVFGYFFNATLNDERVQVFCRLWLDDIRIHSIEWLSTQIQTHTCYT